MEKIKVPLLSILFVLITPLVSRSQETLDEPSPEETTEISENNENLDGSEDSYLNSIWPMISLSTKWYLHYRVGQTLEEQEDGSSELSNYNRFNVGRGYLTFKFKPVKWFESRSTLDVHQDDTGDWQVRVKYMYGKFKVPVETAVLTEPYLEFGIAHTPWFDYEEHINYYRMQGMMFIERNGIQNSADLGVTFGGLLGRKLSKDYQKKVNKAYPGTWGSYSLGIYNGGGYHADENNGNKVFEGRLSIRPLGCIHPNWQVAGYGVLGKGNTASEPDWKTAVVFTSYDHQYFVLTGQYAFGSGNQKGNQVLDADENDEIDSDENHAFEFKGPSGFAEIRLPMIRSSLMSRFDYWQWEGTKATKRIIGGYAFHILGERKNVVVLDYDRVMQEGRDDTWDLKLTLQVAF